MIIIAVILGLYIFGMIAIGFFWTKKASESQEEYYLGGRSVGPMVTAIAAGSTGRSAWLALGLIGTGFIAGAGAIWAMLGYTLAELFGLSFLGIRLRNITVKFNAITWPDFLEERFQDKKQVLRLVSVICIVLFYVTYVAAQLKGSTKLFGFVFGMTPITAVILSGVVVMIYTMAGGYLAVIWTSFIQGAIMLLSLVIMPFILLFQFAGTGIVDQIMAIDPMLLTVTGTKTWTWIIGQIGIGLGSWGAITILTRYMSARDPKEMRKSGMYNALWNVICATGAVVTGLLARVAWESAKVLPNSDPELISPLIGTELMNPIIGGIIVAGIVSAIMSTIDQQILTVVTTITRDFYKKMINKDASDKQVVTLGRWFVVIVGIVSIYLALKGGQSVYWFVLFAWSGLGAAFGPVAILSLYWKGMTKWGAFTSIIVGMVVTIIWNQTPALKAIIYELVPAFAIAFIAAIIVSKLTTPPTNVEEAFKAMEEGPKQISGSSHTA